MNGFSELRAGVEIHLVDDEVLQDVAIKIKSVPMYGSWVKVSYLEKKWLLRKIMNVRAGFYRYTRSSAASTENDPMGITLNNTYGATIASNGLYVGLAWVEQGHIEIDSNQYGIRSKDYFNKMGFDILFAELQLHDDNLEPFMTDEGVEAFLTSTIGWRLFWETERLTHLSWRMELGQRPAFKNDFYFLVGLGWAFTLQL